MNLTSARIDTPCGSWFAVMEDEDLVILALDAECEKRALARRFPGVDPKPARRNHPVLTAISAYLEGDIGALDRIPVKTAGTAFQEKVWKALRRIPAGKPISYAALAVKIGMPTAVRAVANANAQNPVAIVVPCHRVIAKDGSLCGFGGGLPMKKWLLTHEGWSDESGSRLPGL